MHLHFWHLISTFQWVFAVSNLCSVHVNIQAVLCAVVALSRACIHLSVRTQTCHVSATTDYKIQNLSTIYNVSKYTISIFYIYLHPSLRSKESRLSTL